MWTSDFVCQLCAARMPCAREISFQKFHSVVRFLSLSNNLGIRSSLDGQPGRPAQIAF
jgi:hypothetical protein